MPVNREKASHRRRMHTAEDRPTSQVLRRQWVQAMRPLIAQTRGMFDIRDRSAQGSGSATATGGVSIGFSKEFTEGLQADAGRAFVDAFAQEYVLPLLTEGVQNETVIKDMRVQVERLREQMDAELQGVQGLGVEERGVALERVKEQGLGAAAHEVYGASITAAAWGGASPKGGMGVLIGSPGAGSTGSPQAGSATLYFQSSTPGVNSTPGTLRFSGKRSPEYTHAYERFGWASAACDVNLDGVLDAVICAPSFGGKQGGLIVYPVYACVCA